MKGITIGELRAFMEARNLSAEQVARDTRISNMTIRRLLKHDPKTSVPPKYELQIRTLLRGAPEIARPEAWLGLPELQSADFGSLLTEIEHSGENCKDVAQLEKDAKSKLSDPNVGRLLKENVQKLIRAVRSKKLGMKERAAALGALIYFVNPFDLIPDAVPGVGYIDDFAILVLVVALIAKATEKRGDEGTPRKA